MKPNELYMQNFMSYEKALVGFRHSDIVVIVGQNGAGKSTILQAITYALWGQVRTTSHNDVVRRGASKCLVRLDFTVDGQEYTITRERDLSGRGTSNLTFGHVDGTIEGEFHHVLTKPTIKETQDEIDKVVGMSYNIFANSVLLQQGEAGNFSSAPPADRKKLLGELIGLEELQAIEKKARAALSEIDQRAKVIAVQLGDIDLELDALDGAETTYKANKSLQDTIRARISEFEEKQSEQEQLLRTITEFTTKRTELRERVDILLESRDTIDDLVAKREKAICGYNNIIGDGEIEIREDVRELDHLEDDLECMDHLKHTYEIQQQGWALCAEKKALEDNKHRAEKVLDRLLRDLRDQEDGIKEIEEKIVEGEKNIARLSGINYGVLNLKTAIRKSRTGECPICHQHIKDIDEIVGWLLREIDNREKTIARIQGTTIDLSTTLADLRHGHDKSLETVEKARRKVAVLEGQIELVEDKYLRIETTVHHDPPVEYDADEHERIKARIDELFPARVELSKVLDAKKHLADAEREIEELTAKAAILTGDMDVIYQEIMYNEQKLSPLPYKSVIEKEIAELADRLTRLDTNLQEAIEKTATAEADMKRYAALEKKYELLEKEAAELHERWEILDLLVQATSKTGAQALLIEAALPQIEKDANEFLRAMSPNMNLALESQRVTAKGTVSETLDIRVTVDGEDAPIETLSGGERFRADLSIRLAIGKLLTRRSGAKADMLAIDEGFGSQDDDGIESIIETITSLKDLFPLILIITHVEKVAKSFSGDVLMVSKERGRSILRS